jgi:hypothetical protein
MHASSCTDPKRDELEMDIDTEEDDELRARGDELDIVARLTKPIGRATIFLTTRLGRSTTMTCLIRARSASALRWRYATTRPRRAARRGQHRRAGAMAARMLFARGFLWAFALVYFW